jgi:hypothetical protein
VGHLLLVSRTGSLPCSSIPRASTRGQELAGDRWLSPGGFAVLWPARGLPYPPMLKALRSRRFALATLAAFVLAQPVVACAALCLFEKHHAVAHSMPSMSRDNPALSTSTCHTTSAGAVQRDRFEILSPMAPTRAALLTVAPTRWAEPVRSLPAPPHVISRTVEPPPPRLV